jgi:hypothetical protein
VVKPYWIRRASEAVVSREVSDVQALEEQGRCLVKSTSRELRRQWVWLLGNSRLPFRWRAFLQRLFGSSATAGHVLHKVQGAVSQARSEKSTAVAIPAKTTVTSVFIP